MIKAVIFDSDGMLTHGPRFSEHYAKEHGISLDVMTPFFTGPFRDCLVGRADLKEELQKGWLEKWQWKGTADELLEYWFNCGDELDKTVFDSVATIRAKGIPCFLATNQEKYRTDYLSEKFGYDKAFDKVFSSAYLGQKKPTPEFFDAVSAYIRDKFGPIEKSEVLFWDDDIENIEGAKAYGLETRQFVNTEQYQTEMKSMLK